MNGTRAGRAAGLANVAWGAALLVGDDALWRRLTGRSLTGDERRVVQVLSVRHLAQGVVQLAVPTRLEGLWAATDLAHAVSMLALAATDPGRRRPALVSALVSAATATKALAALVLRRRATHRSAAVARC